MDPLTAASLAQLLATVATVVERQSRGEITDAEARTIFEGSSDRLKAAIDAFNKAGGAPG